MVELSKHQKFSQTFQLATKMGKAVSLPSSHEEIHYVQRSGWLRAAVLGANDGIISIAALLTGVAAAGAEAQEILLTGIVGLVAGALSMAAGEYVSVSSQKDLEKADIERERQHIQAFPQEELQELADIYIVRGLSPATARKVAREFSEKDALRAHIRDELGILEITRANPVLAGLSSALTFGGAALLPLCAAVLFPPAWAVSGIFLISILSLALLGAFGAKAGGAKKRTAVFRVTILGAVSMGIAYALGQAIGISI